MNEKKFFGINFWLFSALFAVIALGLIFSLVNLTRGNFVLGKKAAVLKEAQRSPRVEAIIIKEPSCLECVNLQEFVSALKKNNVEVTEVKEMDRMSEEGNALIKKYSLEKIPTVILKGEVDRGDFLQKNLPPIGLVTGDEFVLKQLSGPYVLVATGEIKGVTELTLLTDSSCASCYDVRVHEQIVQQFGLRPKSLLVDVKSDEGKELITKYAVRFAPLLIIKGDMDNYPQLKQIWPQVGTIEKDGAYVFRNGVQQMGVYKDLRNDKIIDPAQQAGSTKK